MEQARQDGGNSKGSLRPVSSNSRSDHSAVSDSPKSSLPVSRPLSGNQHINRSHQPVGQQKAVQWKSNQKQHTQYWVECELIAKDSENGTSTLTCWKGGWVIIRKNPRHWFSYQELTQHN
ncbi:uncharacterized protein LOC132035848 [Lycium ferocissimum]|uniref:uncharacterized protein LOC132035848 n=1 Tax=Lycium ferocissimum TaxID=112874 RepID=UPI002815DE24|nr:uncharacterized protein LOC132035848 [Lycium ferocissimum]